MRVGGGSLVHMGLAVVEVVEREIVGACDHSELVAFPIVVIDDEAVRVTLAAVEDGERHVERLTDGEA